MPDQNRQSLGQWVNVDYVDDISSFPKGCGLSMHSFGFLVWKEIWKRGKKVRGWKSWHSPFSVLIYLLLFIMVLLLKLFYKTKSKGGTQITSLTKSCIALKILTQHLHISKRLFYGLRVFFWRFFLKCILCTFNPVRYCNNTGTFHPPG